MKQFDNVREVRLSSWTNLIRLNVVVPKAHVRDLMTRFGETFAQGGKVEDYYPQPGGNYHVLLVVSDQDKYKLQAFISRYSEAQSLLFVEATKAGTKPELEAQAAGPVL